MESQTMTTSQCLATVEGMLTDMNVRYSWGDRCMGLEAIGFVNDRFKDDLKQIEDDFESKKITPEQYVDLMRSLINKTKIARILERLERAIENE